MNSKQTILMEKKVSIHCNMYEQQIYALSLLWLLLWRAVIKKTLPHYSLVLYCFEYRDPEKPICSPSMVGWIVGFVLRLDSAVPTEPCIKQIQCDQWLLSQITVTMTEFSKVESIKSTYCSFYTFQSCTVHVSSYRSQAHLLIKDWHSCWLKAVIVELWKALSQCKVT